MLDDATTQKLARRFGDLLANDPEFATTMPDQKVAESILRQDIGLAGVIGAVTKGYADRPALGQRAAVVAVSDGGRRVLEFERRFETVTYGQLWRRASGLAAVLSEDGLLAGQRIATLGLASVDYTAIDMAVALLGCVSVPLHTGAPVSVLATMVEEAEPSVIACSAAHIADGVRLALSSADPARLIVFDYRPDVDNDREGLDMARARIAGADSAVQLDVLDDLLERGYALPPTDLPPPDDSQLAAIVYTSGSSGKPKGAMLTAGLVKGAWSQGSAMMVQRNIAIPSIMLSYLPMSHTGGRSMLFATLGSGGTAYFAAVATTRHCSRIFRSRGQRSSTSCREYGKCCTANSSPNARAGSGVQLPSPRSKARFSKISVPTCSAAATSRR